MPNLVRKMFKFVNLRLFFVFIVFFSSFTSVAQQESESGILGESTRDAFLVLGTAGAGAILGLSTLSFVEEPGAHLKNIVVGGALGIIVGVGVVAYLQANKSQNLYLDGASPQEQGGSLQHLEEVGPLASSKDYYEGKSLLKKSPFVTFSFDF